MHIINNSYAKVNETSARKEEYFKTFDYVTKTNPLMDRSGARRGPISGEVKLIKAMHLRAHIDIHFVYDQII